MRRGWAAAWSGPRRKRDCGAAAKELDGGRCGCEMGEQLAQFAEKAKLPNVYGVHQKTETPSTHGAGAAFPTR